MKVWIYPEYYVSENLFSDEYRYILSDRKTDKILLRIKIENEQHDKEIRHLLDENEDIFTIFLDRE